MLATGIIFATWNGFTASRIRSACFAASRLSVMTHVEKRGKRGQNTKYRRRLHALVYIEADKTDSNVCLALDIRAEKVNFRIMSSHSATE